jgi:iron complex outermembrane recepter protein
MPFRMLTVTAGLGLTLGLASAAWAQTAAGTGDAAVAALDEVVVTARRVEERLQDVPISITVFNQSQLEDRNVLSIQDLATYTPSLSAPGTFGADNATFAIRGFVQAGNTTPSVGVFFADVVASHTQGQLAGGNGAGPGLFFDLASVQVLKGPQGTLFGRNTTGGDILLVPQKPSSELGGYVEQSIGNYDMERTQAVLNAPLNDQIRLRLAVDRETRQGYLHNLSGIGPNHFGDVDYTALRASVVIDVTPNLENYTIASWSTSDTNGDYPKAFGYTPGPSAAVTAFGANIPGQIAATSAHYWDIENGNQYASENIRQWRVINTTTWSATDLLTLKNIASYSQFAEAHNANIFGDSGAEGLLPIALGTTNYLVSVDAVPGSHNTAEQTITEELQLQGRTADSRLSYQSGVYYETNFPLDGFQSTQANVLLNCINPFAFECTDIIGRAFGAEGFVGSSTLSSTEYHFRDFGVYGQANYKLMEQLTLSAGVRYTKDQSDGLSQVLQLGYPAPNTPNYSCGFPSPLTSGGTSAAIDGNHALCDYRAQQNSHAPTWMVDLEYKPLDTTMIYAKQSRGYRQGNVDVSQYGLGSWKPEKVDTYEIGSKLTFDGAVRGAFNIAAFYNDFTNQQLALNAVACTPNLLGTAQCPFIPAPAAGIGNAGKSRIDGVEIDASITPVAGLRFDVGYAYLDTKLLSVTIPAAPPGFTSISFPSAVGGPLPFSPKNKVSLTGSYRLPLSATIGQISLSATFTHQTSEFNSQTAVPGFQTLGSESNLNLDLSWNNIFGHPLDLSLFGTNVTDEKYYLATGGTYLSFGYDYAFLNQPTMYGARFKYRFGN